MFCCIRFLGWIGPLNRPVKTSTDNQKRRAGMIALAVLLPVAAGQAQQLTVQQILDGYENGSMTAEQVTREYLDRIERFESNYNAFTFLNTSALEDARAIDRRRATGEALGELAGIPVVIKETMDVVGYPSTMGWAATSAVAGGVDFFPQRNATIVQRLIDAGAIILGKTNIPPFSESGTRATGSWAGDTLNAVNPAIAPGGSSSGTATAVAAGFAPLGLAEETGGSIQNPAAAQSLVGVVPTFSLVPNDGVAPLAASTLDVMGPIATTVYDAALLLDVIAGTTPNDPKTAASDERLPDGGYTAALDENALDGKRLGLYGPGWKSGALSDETAALYQRALVEVEARGATVVADPFAESGFAQIEQLADGFYDVRGYESLVYDLARYLEGLGVDSIDQFVEAAGSSPFAPGGLMEWYMGNVPGITEALKSPGTKPDLRGFDAVRRQYRERLNEVFEIHDLDAMVLPHAMNALPPLTGDEVINETTVAIVNIGGFPVVTVPAGRYDSNGSPFGLLFVGQPFSEALLLAMAYDYEQATQHRIVPNLD